MSGDGLLGALHFVPQISLLVLHTNWIDTCFDPNYDHLEFVDGKKLANVTFQNSIIFVSIHLFYVCAHTSEHINLFCIYDKCCCILYPREEN